MESSKRLAKFQKYISFLKKKLCILLDAKPYAIVDVASKHISSASICGVYAISLKGSDDILYIGKNETATIAERAKQHIYMREHSDLKTMIKRYPDLAQNLQDYCIRWIDIPMPDDRHFFEAFAIGVLRPRMNFKKINK